MKLSRQSLLKWIVSLFLLFSGTSALIYQVVWVRLLSLSIGSTSISISTVLAVFFLGLGLGSFYAQSLIKRFKNPLKIYLVVELLIALSATALLPILLNLDYYISMLPFSEAGFGFKFFVVMLLLLVPTFLIGTTFPLLMVITISNKKKIVSKLAHFYAYNSIGAVGGALLSGFILIPHYGLDGTIYIGAFINIVIVLVGFILYKQLNSTEAISLQQPQDTQESKKVNNKALIVLFVTGLSSMATEVGWMKFLIVYTGNTIYGFSLILAMFLAGISIGSLVIKFSIFSNIKEYKILFFGLILLSVALLFARVGLGSFPEIYAQLNTMEVDPFIYRWSKYLVMFLFLLPASAIFGALFPVALKYYSPNVTSLHLFVGKAYGVNIIAGIIGSILAGFFIIEYFSTDILLTAIALFTLLSSLLFIKDIKIKKASFIWIGFSIVFILLSNNLKHIDYNSMIDIVVKRNSPPFDKNIILTTHYIKESQSGVISMISYENKPCIMKLLNNGMSESWIDICDENNLLLNEFLLGEIASLLNPRAKKAFVVGYGGGTTVRALSMNDLEVIDVVELDSAVIDAVKTVYKGRLPIDNRVNITINDARNSLLMSKEIYDIIVSQPSHPWLNGGSNIMNKDFFEIVKSRLSEDGINGQWVPLFTIDVATLKSIIKAYTDSFEYVISFVNLPTRDFLMFGSKQPMILDYNTIKKQISQAQISAILKRYNIQNPNDLMRYFALSKEQLVKITSSAKAATDSNLLAEIFLVKHHDIEGNNFKTLEFITDNLHK